MLRGLCAKALEREVKDGRTDRRFGSIGCVLVPIWGGLSTYIHSEGLGALSKVKHGKTALLIDVAWQRRLRRGNDLLEMSANTSVRLN